MIFSFSRRNHKKETWKILGRNGALLYEIWCNKFDKNSNSYTPY